MEPFLSSNASITTLKPRVNPIQPECSALEPNVGSITFIGFSEHTPGKVLDALELFKAKGVRGVMLDLCETGSGGLYTAAEHLAGVEQHTHSASCSPS
jgi:C-terminal processing protease CtpA/Prc